MKHIKIMIGTQVLERQAPSSWDEVSQSDFCDIVSSNILIAGIPIPALQILLHIDEDDAQWILPADWYAIAPEFSFLSDYSSIGRWLIPSITLSDGRECFPPAADFDNVSWEEFVFADQLAQAGNWAAVAATLFRPYSDTANENQDPRIPFTRFGLSNRLDLFSKLPKATLKAVEVNYLALRRRMTKKYRHLFSGSSSSSSNSQGWPEISREVLGANVWNEQQLSATSVNGVLSMINSTIKQNQERQRNERLNRHR